MGKITNSFVAAISHFPPNSIFKNPIYCCSAWIKESSNFCRLEELLIQFPPEEVEAKRWQKIAAALGNRTPIQVGDFFGFTKQSLVLTTLKKKPFENIVRKEENAGNQHFLLFPQCFLPYQWQSKYLNTNIMPPYRKIGEHIVLPLFVCPSVCLCLSVCLHKLHMKI